MTPREFNRIVDAMARYAHCMQAVAYHEASPTVAHLDLADARKAWDKVESLLKQEVDRERAKRQ